MKNIVKHILNYILKHARNAPSNLDKVRWKVTEHGGEIDITIKEKTVAEFKQESRIKSKIPDRLIPSLIKAQEAKNNLKSFWDTGFYQKAGEKSIAISPSKTTIFDSRQEADTYLKTLGANAYITSVA